MPDTFSAMSPEVSQTPRGPLGGPKGEFPGLGSSWMLSGASWQCKIPGVQASSQPDGGGFPWAGWALCSQRPTTQSFHLPHPGYPGPVLALNQGLGDDWGHALDTLVHIIQGGGHLFASTGKIMGLGPASSQVPGGLTIPFFHISSCLADSTFPPELRTMLQRWETCF